MHCNNETVLCHYIISRISRCTFAVPPGMGTLGETVTFRYCYAPGVFWIFYYTALLLTIPHRRSIQPSYVYVAAVSQGRYGEEERCPRLPWYSARLFNEGEAIRARADWVGLDSDWQAGSTHHYSNFPHSPVWSAIRRVRGKKMQQKDNSGSKNGRKLKKEMDKSVILWVFCEGRRRRRVQILQIYLQGN